MSLRLSSFPINQLPYDRQKLDDISMPSTCHSAGLIMFTLKTYNLIKVRIFSFYVSLFNDTEIQRLGLGIDDPRFQSRQG